MKTTEKDNTTDVTRVFCIQKTDTFEHLSFAS